MTRAYRHLFGPVPSRRFGRSLGVDLSPLKTCNLDCVFCQLGGSPATAATRREYVPVQDVIAELEHWLAHDGQADFITLSGSGEPTLNTGFGEVLGFIREQTEIPALLMTNGTLLHLPEVRQAAALASVVKLSMGAWDLDSFARLNRPHVSLSFEDLVRGEQQFRAIFAGEIRLEVFVVEGINATPAAMRKIAARVATIAPDRVQLNTAVRPAAESGVTALSREQLDALALCFDPPAEVIASFDSSHTLKQAVTADAVLAILRRRPCTARQLADASGGHINEILKVVASLEAGNQVSRDDREGERYVVAAP